MIKNAGVKIMIKKTIRPFFWLAVMNFASFLHAEQCSPEKLAKLKAEMKTAGMSNPQLYVTNLVAACNCDDADSCLDLGSSARLAGTPQAKETSDKYLRKSCELGAATACDYMNMIKKDKAVLDSLPSVKESCEKNANLSDCLQAGNLEARSGETENSVKHWSTACDGGVAHACIYLAGHYENRKVNPDFNKAVEYFRKACKLGVACNELKVMESELGQK
jgi:TPR repeat protein